MNIIIRSCPRKTKTNKKRELKILFLKTSKNHQTSPSQKNNNTRTNKQNNNNNNNNQPRNNYSKQTITINKYNNKNHCSHYHASSCQETNKIVPNHITFTSMQTRYIIPSLTKCRRFVAVICLFVAMLKISRYLKTRNNCGSV